MVDREYSEGAEIIDFYARRAQIKSVSSVQREVSIEVRYDSSSEGRPYVSRNVPELQIIDERSGDGPSRPAQSI